MELFDYLICVATVNGPERLENFIKSVIKHTNGFNYKISITDDASLPDLAEQNYAIALKYNCYYTKNDARSGVPFSWNRATEQADANYIVIANDDIIVVPGWLDAYRNFWNANRHLKLGVVAWPATGNLGDQSNKESFVVGPDQSHIITPIVACIGYLFVLPRALLMEVGKFDERYFATWEEIDLGAKLCMNGYKSIGLDAPVVWHQGGASFGDPINRHVAMNKQSLAQGQWINKWALMLNIDKTNKGDSQLIKEISDELTSKIPDYKLVDFNYVQVDGALKKTLEEVSIKNNIHGWFNFDDVYRHAVFMAQKNAMFVEIGSWLGQSACYMATLIKASNKNIKFDCIDIWSNNIMDPAFAIEINDSINSGISMLEKFKFNMVNNNVNEYVNAIQAISWEAASYYEDNSLDFVFLDADHSYDSVKKDLEAWWPKVKLGGIFAGHDYTELGYGVKKAVDEFFNIMRIKINILKNNNTWLAEKI